MTVRRNDGQENLPPRRSKEANDEALMNMFDEAAQPLPVTLAVAEILQVAMQKIEIAISRIESSIKAICDGIKENANVKEYYNTSEAAKIWKRSRYTVSEWCRHSRVNAVKAPSGRGEHGEWRISHEEIERYKNEGLLPPVPSSRNKHKKLKPPAPDPEDAPKDSSEDSSKDPAEDELHDEDDSDDLGTESAA